MNEAYRFYNYSPSKSYGIRPDFRAHWAHRTGFTSLYAVTQDTAKAIEAEGTVAGFKGVVWSERLWLDIDTYEEAERVELRLKDMGIDFIAYDSGGKGAHFGLLRDALPSHFLPAKDKQWVKRTFPEADTSIYTHLHPFRLPGTVHEGTGRVKELVSRSAGRAITLPPLEEKNVFIPSHVPGHVSVFDCFRVMANTVPAWNGERHERLTTLAYALKQDAGVDSAAAAWWLKQTNLLFEDPKGEEEIDNIIRHVYQGER